MSLGNFQAERQKERERKREKPSFCFFTVCPYTPPVTGIIELFAVRPGTFNSFWSVPFPVPHSLSIQHAAERASTCRVRPASTWDAPCQYLGSELCDESSRPLSPKWGARVFFQAPRQSNEYTDFFVTRLFWAGYKTRVRERKVSR